MNTSSRLVSSRAPPVSTGFKGGDAFLEAIRIPGADVQGIAKGDHLINTGQWFKSTGQTMDVATRHTPGGKSGVLNQILNLPGGQQVPIGDVSEPLAPFRLVHVMGADERRNAF